MTRPKVPDDKRQRTAQACDSCKRRKQKCNGLKPCNTCTKRNLTCSYTPNNPDQSPNDSGAASPPKRRAIETSSSKQQSTLDADTSREAGKSCIVVPPWDPRLFASEPVLQTREQENQGEMAPDTFSPLIGQGGTSELEFESKHSTTSGEDEEVVVYSSTRMLQDSTGRLLYIGDAATLSFLQLMRMIVESISGPSPFTNDPKRHRIMEVEIPMPPNLRPLAVLPDRKTADILLDSYFANTVGFVEVFNRKAFYSSVDACYADPLSADSSFLCLLYLVFAIGLAMANPAIGAAEEDIIRKLRSESVDRAEWFFRTAKSLGDPGSGFGDADFWSVQALLLMSVYTLCISKRNAAYAYYGMAVRSAFALGLHREEMTVIFTGVDLAVRRNLWRSLFVFDRFLASSLGRPLTISEEDCSGDVLMPVGRSGQERTLLPSSPASSARYTSLEACVRSSQVTGEILRKVYSKRKISTRIAQDIVSQLETWSLQLEKSLDWRQLAHATSPAQGQDILHVHLCYCHSLLLLTRPFLLFLLTKVQQQQQPGSHHPTGRGGSRLERFSEICVVASNHSLDMVHTAYESRLISRRNPWVLYFMFTCALVMLSNEFAALHDDPEYERRIAKTVQYAQYSANTDPQAERILYIITTFRDVVTARRKTPDGHPQRGPPISCTPSCLYDVKGSLFSPLESRYTRPTSAEFMNVQASHPALPSGNPSLSPVGTGGSHAAAVATPSHIQSQSPCSRTRGSITDANLSLDDVPVTGPPPDHVDLHTSLGIVHPADVHGSLEGEFEFDTIWNWAVPPPGGMGALPGQQQLQQQQQQQPHAPGAHHHISPPISGTMGAGAHRFDGLHPTFAVPPAHMGQADPNGPPTMPLNVNVPLYPAYNYR